MSRYAEHIAPTRPAQSEQARPDQVPNSAGGFAFQVSKWTQLDRFLVLGAEGGTYYIGEKKLVRENAKAVEACLAEDGPRTVARIVEVSDAGRAPKNDPAILALALAVSSKDPKTRAAAMAAIPKVCRTGTHLLHFVNDLRHFRGWSMGLKKAIARWYTQKPAHNLAYQVAKYQQRDGFSQRDLIRLVHPKSPSRPHAAVLAWSARGMGKIHETTKKQGTDVHRGPPASRTDLPELLIGVEEIHAKGTSIQRACELIVAHRMPHECVPNEMKGDPRIWEALLEGMRSTALIRNLGKMTAVGLLGPMAEATELVCRKLTDPKVLFKDRVHPLGVLIAQKVYAQGHGEKGKLTWRAVPRITDALDDAFYQAFQAIEPTGKRIMLALDVSGSMGGACVAGTSLTCREAASAMAMATARTESKYMLVAFTAHMPGQWNVRYRKLSPQWGSNTDGGLIEVNISARQRLDDVMKTTNALQMGPTDCSLPMIYAYAKNIPIDAFIVYTDSETWAGEVHPYQAIREYRQKFGIPSKLVVVGMEANPFTIADPRDAGMMDVVGFDSAAPAAIGDFIAGREVQA